MKAWRANSAINNVRNKGPELGEPLKDDGEGQIELFYFTWAVMQAFRNTMTT
jgi:hypothetical protein